MAVKCEAIDIIVPIANVDRVFPGGFAAYMREHRHLLGGVLWYDSLLLRDGAMSPADTAATVDAWRRRGLEPMGIREGQKYWNDLCVVEHMASGPTLPCEWLEFNASLGCVHWKGTPAQPVIGRAHFSSR